MHHPTESLSRLSHASASHRESMTTTTTSPLAGGLGMRNGHFVDAHGRVQLLRGVNLGGASKLPAGYAHVDPLARTAFYDGATGVSFVNRPFPLDQADVHFARLKRWGLTFLRVIVTWEAIEHAGPGQYDREYLTYMRALLDKAATYGMQIYIDPHQDVWSRWTGGDGAPLWTLEAIGLEPRHFEATKAAMCVETFDGDVADYPKMIWPTNYFKFACATMFTLFFAGKTLAPKCHVNGVQVQEFLQSHYLNALGELAKALAGLKNIVGFGTMNEPSAGYIGVQDLNAYFHKSELKYGLAPTPFQGMCLADGVPQVVGSWSNGIMQHVFGRPDKKVRVDPGCRAWKQGHRCVWMDEGVWQLDAATGKPQLLKPNYFARVDFGKDCYVAFAQRYAETIRAHLPTSMVFVELPPLEFSRSEFPELTPAMLPHAVNATHWYDGVTLFMQMWLPWFTVDPQSKTPAFGRAAVTRMHEKQLRHIKEFGRDQMHHAPTLIGETGIPFNLNGGKAYRTGNYEAQIDALDHTISCLEANLLSYTLWCYTSDNSHQYGDQWNLEDLSIVSEAHTESIVPTEDDAAARSLLAFARPHATKIAGIPTTSFYRLARRRYELEFTSDGGIVEPTEVYVPHCQYPKGYTVAVSDGTYEVQTHDAWDLILYRHDEKAKSHRLMLTTKDAEIEKQYKFHQWSQNLLLGGALVLVVVFIVVLASQ